MIHVIHSYNLALHEPAYLVRLRGNEEHVLHFIMHTEAMKYFRNAVAWFLQVNGVTFQNNLHNVHHDPAFDGYGYAGHVSEDEGIGSECSD